MGVLKSSGWSLAVALGLAGMAQAHVSLSPKTAEAGGYQVVRFGVGHGCDGKATTGLRIEVPAGVASARPQPKPGWELAIERAPGGGEAVRAITWRGNLPADQYEEFLIQLKLPAASGPLDFAAIQSCGDTEVRWTEQPAAGAARPKHPMPVLILTSPPGEAGEPHRH